MWQRRLNSTLANRGGRKILNVTAYSQIFSKKYNVTNQITNILNCRPSLKQNVPMSECIVCYNCQFVLILPSFRKIFDLCDIIKVGRHKIFIPPILKPREKKLLLKINF